MTNSFSMKLFTYDSKMNSFSAEASDLPGSSIPGRFSIVSEETGSEVYFEFTHQDKDSTEEDIYGWNYASNGFIASDKLKKSPKYAEVVAKMRGMVALIIND